MGEKPSSEMVISWMETLSNWGRWGSDDELGTLNYIGPGARRRGASSVRTGESVSCSWVIDPTSVGMKGFAQRFMVATGREQVIDTPRGTYANETLQLQHHGPWVTHLDGLSHVAWDGKFYNDRPVDCVTVSSGATSLGIESALQGIVTRGVLLDVAAVRGVEMLAFGEGAHPDDLEAAEERQGVEVLPGDAVLLSTGLSHYRTGHAEWTSADGAPGFHAASLPWLHDRQVAVIGSDGPNDTYPSGYPELHNPIHLVGIRALGLWLIDTCRLDGLLELCRARQQWDFLFTVAPVPFVGATGSPVNPIAVL
jgi:kynurenine formamidase